MYPAPETNTTTPSKLQPGQVVEMNGTAYEVCENDSRVWMTPVVCKCGTNQVCDKCPESKKRRMLHKLKGVDPHVYVTPARGASNRMTKREERHHLQNLQQAIFRKTGKWLSIKEVRKTAVELGKESLGK